MPELLVIMDADAPMRALGDVRDVLKRHSGTLTVVVEVTPSEANPRVIPRLTLGQQYDCNGSDRCREQLLAVNGVGEVVAR
jgi:hypothetical protein